MTSKLLRIRQDIYDYRQAYIIKVGFKKGKIAPYDENLIKKLRNIYYAGIPASIILLSNYMSNGECYNRAWLMSRAFLDEDEDVQIICASIDNIRVNPLYPDSDDPFKTAHCFVKRITKEGRHLIYDTSYGLVFDEKWYWLLEHPKVIGIYSKDIIREYIKSHEYLQFENSELEKYNPNSILPMIEANFEGPREIYAGTKAKVLQREIEHFKKIINYDGLYQEVDKEIKKYL